VTKKGKKTVEVVYLITSSDAEPAALAAWVKAHWEMRPPANPQANSKRVNATLPCPADLR